MTSERAKKHGWRSALLLWTLLIVFDTSVQLLLKTVGNVLPEPEWSLRWALVALAFPSVWIAIFCYVATFAVWMLILARSSLSLAFPATALNYVSVLLGSRWLLGEQILPLQVVGIALIIAGVAMLREEEAS